MPGNVVSVNLGWREYYVGDSKMPEVLACLKKNGTLIGEGKRNKFGILEVRATKKKKVGRTR